MATKKLIKMVLVINTAIFYKGTAVAKKMKHPAPNVDIAPLSIVIPISAYAYSILSCLLFKGECM